MLTIRQFGKKGRFANQLFQYANLRQQAMDGQYQCPPWTGQMLFGLNDPPVTGEARDIGFRFPLDAAYYDKALFRSLFRFQKDHIGDITEKVEHLRAEGHTLIGLHLRRGDYGTFRRRSARWCFVAPTQWYLDWLKENIQRFSNWLLFIASDEPNRIFEDFNGFHRWWLPSEGWKDFYRDFYTLTQCDVLLISNSTFGFAASMLNERATEFYRPRLSQKRLIPYDPWDAPLVLMDERY